MLENEKLIPNGAFFFVNKTWTAKYFLTEIKIEAMC